MKKKYNEAEIIRVLQEASAGKSIAEVCRANGVSEASFYKWRSRYGGMGSNELKRVKQLELENRRLRKAVSDLTLDNQILKEINSKNW